MIGRWLVGLGVVSTVAAGTWVYRSRDETPRASSVDPEQAGLDDGKPWTVLAFTSPLCGACEQTPGVVAEALGVPEDELGEGSVGFRRVDVTERGDLARALDVQTTPTVVVVDRHGEVRFARQGNPDPDQLANALTPTVGA